jgi:hypothetical protein
VALAFFEKFKLFSHRARIGDDNDDYDEIVEY